ncbi:MAG: hypothetical protein M3Y82_00175 [Verrucomicrobiota bacterium]|nr:hypothetical protein [Verrucomicrobiota bacterium]
MRFLLIILSVGLLAGCRTKSSSAKANHKPTAVSSSAKSKATPANGSVGKVSMLNKNGRFVVVTFSAGNVPAADRPLNVYRNGLKVGELKVTGPQREENTVADILKGEAQVNDEVRED